MKNPLYKRIKRELKQDMGKYIALFLFLCLTVGFCSGFIVADGSMKQAYSESFDKYNVEDGHFSLEIPADEKMISELERKEDITVYPIFYKDIEIKDGRTLRIYKNRDKVNQVDVLEGKLPGNKDEIAIDRLFAENNQLSTGDFIKVGNKDFKISGLVALTDYSALFKNNTDMMLNAQKFAVSVVNDTAFDSVKEGNLINCYAWTNNNSLDEEETDEKAKSIETQLYKRGKLTDFVKQSDNQAITFAGDDLGKDKAMIQWLLYIVMAVMAFVFSVTTRNTLEQESSVIGTLRASGYTKTEMMCHYMILPVMVTLGAAIAGNVLGYTFMKDIIAQLYYHSYSLTSYHTIWSSEAFVKTTLIPVLIIIVVNILVLISTLALPPLKFLRHELKRTKKKKAIKLKSKKFFTRFRIRIVLQNKSTYFMMFVGVFLASVLLVFGLMMSPLLDNFKEEITQSKIANYQYILKTPVETTDKNAEKYCVRSLENEKGEEITVYGISENSKYLKNLDFSKDKDMVVLSDGLMEKYGAPKGEKYTLSEKHSNKKYTFDVQDSYHYPATLSVFMSMEKFTKTFDVPKDYFSGYFSNDKINDIDKAYIASTITEEDLTIIADQLEDSMGSMFPMIGGFSVIMFVLVIYLLAKIIIEKNAQSISMVKILGYNDSEVSRLYNRATGIVVVISLLLSVPLCELTIRVIYYALMQEFNGWLTYYIATYVYPAMIIMGILCYGVVNFIQLNRIKKIPMSQALKNVE
ncbi:MAG: FtsX-like permease family protein [Ruminococcus sp.]